MNNIKNFDPDLLRIDKKSCKNIGICHIGYTTIKKSDDYENVHSLNPFYLINNKTRKYWTHNFDIKLNVWLRKKKKAGECDKYFMQIKFN